MRRAASPNHLWSELQSVREGRPDSAQLDVLGPKIVHRMRNEPIVRCAITSKSSAASVHQKRMLTLGSLPDSTRVPPGVLDDPEPERAVDE